jgi:hypothetical protein
MEFEFRARVHKMNISMEKQCGQELCSFPEQLYIGFFCGLFRTGKAAGTAHRSH